MSWAKISNDVELAFIYHENDCLRKCNILCKFQTQISLKITNLLAILDLSAHLHLNVHDFSREDLAVLYILRGHRNLSFPNMSG